MENEIIDDFASLGIIKKKKKSSKKVDFDFDAADEEGASPDAPTTDAAAEEDPFDGLKKKSKKKKVIAFDDEDTPAEATEGGDDDLGGLEVKKKKRSSKKSLETFEQALMESDAPKKSSRSSKFNFDFDDEAGGDDMFNQAGDSDDFQMDADVDTSGDPMAVYQGNDTPYAYGDLLQRAFRLIREANPEHGGDRKRYTMIPPQVNRDGAKKTIFANLIEICRRMRRTNEHVTNFLLAELGTSGSVDGAGRLIIRGRFSPKQIESVLRHYIMEYVTCKICKSRDTQLSKDNRLQFIQCDACNSRRSVATIKTGFSAQVGRRRR
ncbi:hypothetical protein H696_03402 [Fonticula alba]|uniref:Translation initiation factor IF2/IF5 domain-containing protein n=1 Tax=Fonticula alba TaxID=691883 RepID=A0A058Z8T4_FONAL|nr:hypothetical protein H696_03402 [Fonticula alba]KCV69937.1 hypothetical protein H696_03402 [Fonticula alba]|eukprot:XP_009495543.1 hypothetical protein H696_03402 [Fonticula alba]